MITPALTGAQPAVYTSNGKTVRVLAQENDKVFDLLNALDANQRKQAILNYDVHDLVLGPGHAGETIQPEGLKAAAMNEKQRAMLQDVILEWAGIVNDAYASPERQRLRQAWMIPTLPGVDRQRMSLGETAARTTAFRGRSSSSRARLKAWAAIRRCMFIPCIAIPRTTMDACSPATLIGMIVRCKIEHFVWWRRELAGSGC